MLMHLWIRIFCIRLKAILSLIEKTRKSGNNFLEGLDGYGIYQHDQAMCMVRNGSPLILSKTLFVTSIGKSKLAMRVAPVNQQLKFLDLLPFHIALVTGHPVTRL